ncbi:hypothetical protein V5799_019294, partial [Amblyomma americanum]
MWRSMSVNASTRSSQHRETPFVLATERIRILAMPHSPTRCAQASPKCWSIAVGTAFRLCLKTAATVQLLLTYATCLEASSVKVTPKIIAFSFAGTAKPGNNVRTTCLLAEGDMPITFTWLRNGVDASHSKNVHIVSHSDFSVLSINPVDAQSAGNYTCIAKNRAGFDSFAAYLDVEAPPTWLREPQDVGGTLGTKLVIKCAASGSPTPTIRWFKLEGGGSLLFTKSALPKNQNGSMVILSLETRDAGQYACEADNGITPTLRKTITVKVNEVPEIRPFSFSKNIPVGGKALVTCWITSGAQPVTFSWLKDGDSLSTVQGTRQKADPDYSVLLLEPVLPSHVGNYTCIAKNKFGFDSYTTVLEVESPPKIRPFSLSKVASKGEKISILCFVSEGTQPFSFSWSKEGKDLQTTENVKVKTESDFSLMIIDAVDEKSAGNYTCIVKNIFGFDTHSAYLDVEAPPLFKKTTGDTNVVQGGSVVLSCHATGSPKPTVSWSRPS